MVAQQKGKLVSGLATRAGVPEEHVSKVLDALGLDAALGYASDSGLAADQVDASHLKLAVRTSKGSFSV